MSASGRFYSGGLPARKLTNGLAATGIDLRTGNDDAGWLADWRVSEKNIQKLTARLMICSVATCCKYGPIYYGNPSDADSDGFKPKGEWVFRASNTISAQVNSTVTDVPAKKCEDENAQRADRYPTRHSISRRSWRHLSLIAFL